MSATCRRSTLPFSRRGRWPPTRIGAGRNAAGSRCARPADKAEGAKTQRQLCELRLPPNSSSSSAGGSSPSPSLSPSPSGVVVASQHATRDWPCINTAASRTPFKPRSADSTSPSSTRCPLTFTCWSMRPSTYKAPDSSSTKPRSPVANSPSKALPCQYPRPTMGPTMTISPSLSPSPRICTWTTAGSMLQPAWADPPSGPRVCATVASVTPYMFRTHGTSLANGGRNGSPAEIPFRSSKGPSNKLHQEGVANTCEIFNLNKLPCILSNRRSLSKKTTVPPTRKVRTTSERHGSQLTAVATSIRLSDVTFVFEFNASQYKRKCRCSTATPFGLPVEPEV
mmetsp:Transcript_95517/g.309493  ORF Transcript_95517/g.309493 Transcript_95517/m.309493 type:complete len:339 (-) Transcript_95517:525-1541(-)